ncbi:MSMEG_1061 family FMN-dependent PPOX-type flavoprotein [Saccharospirillum sp. HFRX-1]|uniref:MSMEG_1061 family FMN-dependent PPOX-type flavoprotein n=1 Tax=unclassified Saccharospirillum TaxID=2633430 RepID=UPI00371B669C
MNIRSEYDVRNEEDLRDVIAPPSSAVPDKVEALLTEQFSQFIARSPFALVATCDAQMQVDVSPKGDAPGFVRVLDDHTLVIPERKGNRLAFGFHNILQTGSISLIFMIPGTRETLRVNGRAHLNRDPDLLAELAADGKAALLATVVKVEEAFFHCGKALVRSGLWQVSTYSAEAETLVRQYFSNLRSMKVEAVSDYLETNYTEEL